MKKAITLIFVFSAFLILTAVAAFGQPANVYWAVRAGGTSTEDGRGIATDGAGNIVVAGYFAGTPGLGGTFPGGRYRVRTCPCRYERPLLTYQPAVSFST